MPRPLLWKWLKYSDPLNSFISLYSNSLSPLLASTYYFCIIFQLILIYMSTFQKFRFYLWHYVYLIDLSSKTQSFSISSCFFAGISTGASLINKMGDLTIIRQFELKDETLESDIDYFLKENMGHTGKPRILVVICKLSCLHTLLYMVRLTNIANQPNNL